MFYGICDFAPNYTNVSYIITMKRIDTFTGLFLSKKLYGFLWFSYKLSVNWTEISYFDFCFLIGGLCVFHLKWIYVLLLSTIVRKIKHSSLVSRCKNNKINSTSSFY